MSIESELETLFVRITTDVSQLRSSAVMAELDKLGKDIQTTIEKNAVVDFNFDFKNLKKNMEFVRADFASFRLFALGIMKEITGSMSGLSNTTEIDKFSDAIVASLGKIKRASGGGAAISEGLTPINQFFVNMKNFSELAAARVNRASDAIVEFRNKVAGIEPSPGMELFKNQVTTLTTSIKGLRVSLAGGIKFGIDKGADIVKQIQDIDKLMASLKITKIVTLKGDVTQLQRDILSAPLPIRTVTVRAKLDFVGLGNQPVGAIPGLSSFTNQVLVATSRLGSLKPPFNLRVVAHMIASAHSTLSPVTSLSGLVAFTGNINRAVTVLSKFGAMPQLAVLARNASSAAVAMNKLNKELTIYAALMTGVGTRIPRVPTASTARMAGGGGGRFADRNNAFGFDPIRRFLAVGTSIATGAAIGFLGFDMMRQVSGFDQNMTNAMSVRQDMTQGVRETMENEILGLSRRVATGPRELADAYRELTQAGYGTANSIQALAVVEQFAFVGSMDAAKAARELTVIQRQLGLVAQDATENANNLRYIGDVITAVSMRSGMSVETFTNGLERLIPHVRFLNRGLEDSVALLASFGRIDASTAVSRSQAVLRAITSQFLRSEEIGGAHRTGVGPGNDPLGQHFRPFRPGQGVQPIHQMTESVRIAAREWRSLGVNPFDEGGNFVGVAAAITQIDNITRDMTAEGRERVLSRLFPGQLRSTATDAIRALLSSSEAMEQFYLAAQRADGVLDQVANVRLQSFNAQTFILRNNITVVAVLIGKILVPALVLVNQALIRGLDHWWSLGQAAQMTTIGLLGIFVVMVSLRFMIPVVTGFFRVLFWETLVAGANAAHSVFTVFWRGLVFGLTLMANTIIFVGMAARFGFDVLIGALSLVFQVARMGVVGFRHLISVFSLFSIVIQVVEMALTGVAFGIHFLETGLRAAGIFVNKLATLSLFVLAFALMKLSAAFALATSAAFLHTIAQSSMIFVAQALSVSLLGVVFSLFAMLGAVVVLNAALGALVSLIGLLISGLFTIAGLAIVGALNLIAGALTYVVGVLHGVDWTNFWENFENAASTAFWKVVGFVSNLRHNMQILGGWMDSNFPIIAANFQTVMGTVMGNLTHNIDTGLARLELSIINMINRIFTGLNAATPVLESLGIMRPGQGNLTTIPRISTAHLTGAGMAPAAAQAAAIPMAQAAWEAAIQEFQTRNPINFVQSPEFQRQLAIRRLNFAQAAYDRVLEDETGRFMSGPAGRGFRGLLDNQPLTRPVGTIPFGQFRFDVPVPVREMIENMFAAPRQPGQGGGPLAEVADRIGNTFREISLNRFVLEGTAGDEDTRRQELVEQQRQTELLRRLVELAAENAAGAAWRIVP